MIKYIKTHFTFANVMMTLALVFAMSGGAYAAKRYLITSTKQISPKVLKQLKGKLGPAGPNGAQGPQGPQGPTGANGKDGAPGTNGENVTYKAVPTSDKTKCGGLGGGEYTLAGKTTLICNGQTGFTDTLPATKTETGSFMVEKAGGASAVSFAIPLSAPLDSAHVHIIAPNTTSADCPGTVETPEAEPGNLCMYQASALAPNTGLLQAVYNPKTFLPGAGTSGAILISSFTEGELSRGTFAVTG